MISRWIATIVMTAALVPGVGRGEVAGKWVAELTSPTLLEPSYPCRACADGRCSKRRVGH